MGPQFKMALPNHISLEKFMRVTQTAVSGNPALLNADRNSLFAACMVSAQQGLLPDGREAALVMFKDKVTFMPMIAGILKKIRNSGELSTITAEIVYKNDEFKYWIDSDGQHLEHKPMMFGERGDAIGTYALAKTKDGAVYIEVMTAEQVAAVRKSSRSATSGPWAGEFSLEMWKKSVIRRLAKRLPSSTDLDMTLSADEELFKTKPIDVAPEETQMTAEVKPAAKKTSRLKTLIDVESQELVNKVNTETVLNESELPI